MSGLVIAEPSARWDGRRILFEVMDADRSVACAISINALQDLSEQRRFKPADLLKCFASARPRIEAIALRKARARPEGSAGVLNIWSDDVEGLPGDDAGVLAATPKPRSHS